MSSQSALIPYSIEYQIHQVRGQKVLLDADLAALYDHRPASLLLGSDSTANLA
jgi:hypothetical protein